MPIQRRLERLATRQAMSDRQEAYSPKAPVEKDPYRFADWPILDLSVGTAYGEKVQPQLQPNAVLAGVGDLGWMTGAFLISASATGYHTGRLDAAHLQLSRKDPDGGMLGPFKATEITIGDVVSPARSFAGRSSQGLGFSISNAPIHRSFEFDRTDLQGPLLPGWEVELYRDQALVDFRTNDGPDTYVFQDVPLYVGKNPFTLVFYGPQGQERTIIRTIYVDGALTEPGETYYRLAINRLDQRALPSAETEARPPKLRYFADLERGLNDHMSLRAQAVRLYLDSEWHLYAGGGLRAAYRGHTLAGQFISDETGGELFEFQIQSSLGRQRLNGNHLQLSKFRSDIFSEQSLSQSTEIRVHGPLHRHQKLNLTQGTYLRLRQYRIGRNAFHASSQVTLTHPRFSLSHSLAWFNLSEGKESDEQGLTGRLLANTRWQSNTWRLRASYGLVPEASLREAALELSRQASNNYHLQFHLSRNLHLLSRTQIKGTIIRTFRKVFASMEMGYSQPLGINTNLSLSFQLLRNPATGQWRMGAEKNSQSPPLIARAFMDENQNGRFDEGEQPMTKVHFAVNGVKAKGETNDQGTALLNGLPLYQPFDIHLDEESFADPFLVASQPARGVTGRPGRVRTLDFPLVQSGEIEGLVFKQMANGERGLSGVTVRLWDHNRNLVAEANTEYDGFFLFEKVKPGLYELDLAPELLGQHGLRVPARQAISVQPNEAVVNRVVFQLEDEGNP